MTGPDSSWGSSTGGGTYDNGGTDDSTDGSADGSTAPDVPGVVVGWRTWQVRDPELARLRSPLQVATEWQPGAPLTARCELRGHPAPDPDCTCGLYAARDPGGVGGVGFGRVTLLGCVALWGTVVEGERGWRGGVGVPVLLFCGPGLPDATRTELTRAYGVPVYPLGRPVAVAVDQPGLAPAAERVRTVAGAAVPDARGLAAAARAFVDAVGASAPVVPERRARRRFTVASAVLAAVTASVLLLPPPDAAAPAGPLVPGHSAP